MAGEHGPGRNPRRRTDLRHRVRAVPLCTADHTRRILPGYRRPRDHDVPHRAARQLADVRHPSRFRGGVARSSAQCRSAGRVDAAATETRTRRRLGSRPLVAAVADCRGPPVRSRHRDQVERRVLPRGLRRLHPGRRRGRASARWRELLGHIRDPQTGSGLVSPHRAYCRPRVSQHLDRLARHERRLPPTVGCRPDRARR